MALTARDIPDGWSTVRLGDLGHFYSGLTGKSGKDFGTGSGLYIPFLNVIGNVVLRPAMVEAVLVAPSEGQNTVHLGDLLFNGSSETPEEVAFACAVTEPTESLYLNSFCFGYRFNTEDVLDPLFFAYLSRSPQGRQVIAPLAQGSTRYNIAKTLLAKAEFYVPPIGEQRFIAKVLLDASAWVDSLDALIAKKRSTKIAVCQSLLANWSGWTSVSLSEVTIRASGFWGHDQPFDGASLCNVIRAGDITPSGKLVSVARRYLSPTELSKSEVLKNDIVITASGNGLGKTWLSDGRADMAASNFVRRLRADGARVIPAFIAHVLLSDIGRRQLDSHTATSAYPNLMPSFFEEEWLKLPSLDEQRAIAGVLTEMDCEIDALVAQRDKAELIRQGMAQDLLSGKVRLI